MAGQQAGGGAGESLPRDLRMWTRGYVNWGVGIIGHAYYDGGMWMVLVYGLILGSASATWTNACASSP